MDKARSYVRVSTLKDSQKDSPEHQQAAIRESAATLGFDIEKVYEDRDSGTSIVARDEVQQLIEEGKRGEYKTLFFSSLSRFSRDALDAISLKRILVNALKIRVISIEDFYDSGIDDNEMLFGIVSVVNQKLSEQISVSSKRGLRQSALSGNFTGSIAPYGYQKAVVEGRKTLIVDEERAPAISLIFDLYVNQNMGEKSVVNYLNNSTDYRPLKTDAWGLTTVQRILQNEAYTGENVFSKFEVMKIYNDLDNLTDREKKQKARKSEQWERSGFKTHPAIIDDLIFKKAQDIRFLRGGGVRGGRKSFVNVFAKFIFCKHCDSAMVVMSSRGGSGKGYRYLMCSKHRRQGNAGCDNSKWIPYEEFRDDMVTYIKNKMNMFQGDTLPESIMKSIGFKTRDLEKNITKYQKTIDDNRKFLFELRKQKMLDELDDQQYEFEKNEYEKEIKAVELKLGEMKKQAEEVDQIERTRGAIKEAYIQLINLDDLQDDTEKSRIILARLIKRIEVDNEGTVDVHTPLGRLG